MICSKCGEEKKPQGFAMHEANCKGGGVAVAERPQSQRGQRARVGAVATPLDQIRMSPQGNTGAWAYYLRPDGATIRDALIICPNGGVPDLENKRMQARYGTNAPEYRARAAAKGFKFIGSKLTPEGVRELINVMAQNVEDETLYCQELIADCEETIRNADRPEIRDQAKKRKGQLQKRIDTMLAPFDADALLAELDEIARAQMLASVDPNIMRVIRSMVGEVNENLAKAVERFARGKAPSGVMEGDTAVAVRGTRSRGDAGASFGGSDFVDVE